MKSQENHICLTKVAGEEIKWVCEEKDLLLDIKYLIKEYYVATINSKGNVLNIKFNNGQKFAITIKEIK